MYRLIFFIAMFSASVTLAQSSVFKTSQASQPPEGKVAVQCLPQKANGKITGYKCIKVGEQSNYQKAGIKEGDVILSVDQVKLDGPSAAMKMFPTIDGGSCKEIVVSRSGREIALKPTFK